MSWTFMEHMEVAHAEGSGQGQKKKQNVVPTLKVITISELKKIRQHVPSQNE
jgi:hypothetical protein